MFFIKNGFRLPTVMIKVGAPVLTCYLHVYEKESKIKVDGARPARLIVLNRKEKKKKI